MRRFVIFLSIFLLSSCQVFSPPPPATVVPSTTPAATGTWTPSPTPSPTPTQTATPTPIPTPTSTPIPYNLSSNTFSVQIQPEDGLYVGDQVSFEVISPPDRNMGDQTVQVQLQGNPEKTFGPMKFGPFGIGNRSQATLQWAWDTSSFSPGEYHLTFSVLPNGPTWTQTVTLQPASALPVQYQGAHWETAKSKCCEIYYVSGTAGARDIQSLLNEADAEAQDASQKIGIDFTQPITITLVPRVLGQGGFANSEISISYLDRNYAGNDFGLVLHHEMIHILDGRLGGDFRPTMLVEGLAVYLTGGHFKKEDLMAHAAALLQIHDAPYNQGDLGWFIPLRPLADNFYSSQHEISYLEGAALIEYMVQKYGWDTYNKFYRDIHKPDNESQADAIDTTLQKHFGLSLQQLQDQFITDLQQVNPSPQVVEDLRQTVDYFDTVRRYQQMLDPSAYFATAWLLDNKQMREKGIVADYLRHPSAPANLALETMLIQAEHGLMTNDYAVTRNTVQAVNQILDAIQAKKPDPFQVNSQGKDFYAIVQALLRDGYRPQHITLSGNTAQAQVTLPPQVELVPLSLQYTNGQWLIQKTQNEDIYAKLFRRYPHFLVLLFMDSPG